MGRYDEKVKQPGRITLNISNKHNLVAKAVKCALLAGAAMTALSSPVIHAAAADDDERTVTVTGSRIKRSDIELSSPVQVIDADDIMDINRYSVADVLRSSTSNSFGSIVPASGGNWQSQATVNLLGVGASRTLVLLDGKRLPGSPSMGGTNINVNQIPMAMVERIEILKDGGSAIYGSDAIAGVVNIILKKDYQGLNIKASTTRSDDEGGNGEDFSILTGITSEKGSMTFAFEHSEQKPIFDRDRPYTAPYQEDTDGDGIPDVNVGISTYGAAIKNPDTELWEPSPMCDYLTANVSGFMGTIETTPTSENRYCGFAYSGVSANQASTNRDSIIVNATYAINDDLDFFARAIVTHNHSFGRYAPPAAPWLGGVPANSDHNPYDEAVEGRFRWYTIGNRDGNNDDYTQDYIAGLTGEFGNTGEYEVYYHHNLTDNKQIGEFYISYSGLFYNIYMDNDLGEYVDNMAATTLVQDYNRFDQFFGGVSWEAGELSGGAIGHYVGFETFDIEYKSTVDAQSEAGLIGGSAGNSSGQTRDIMAVFYEMAAPLTDEIELSVAVRYDDYSDFGSKTTPKVSISYRPNEDLMLRATYGKGFRAPTLQVLSQADSFAADYATDWVVCQANGVAVEDCTEEQYDTTRQANADLDAEESTTINLGVVWSPTQDLTVTADLFKMEIEGQIRFVPIQDIVMMELIGTTNPDPANITVDRTDFENPDFTTSTINGPGQDVTGTNLNLNYSMETDFGMISINSETSYFLEWESDSFVGGPLQDQAGWELQPQYKTQLTTVFSSGDHRLAWNIDYTPSTSSFETPEEDSSGPTGILLTNNSNDSFMIHNLTYSYDFGAYGKYIIGIRNVTDEDPILDSNGEYGNNYDTLYSAGHIGRQFTLSGEWNF